MYSRGLKSIEITPEVREVLGLDESVTELAPTELISAILKAPVDLIYNGGIGTYVKASTETNAQVGDKANDALRVNGKDLRAKIVGEGGNLGFTQLVVLRLRSTALSSTPTQSTTPQVWKPVTARSTSRFWWTASLHTANCPLKSVLPSSSPCRTSRRQGARDQCRAERPAAG